MNVKVGDSVPQSFLLQKTPALDDQALSMPVGTIHRWWTWSSPTRTLASASGDVPACLCWAALPTKHTGRYKTQALCYNHIADGDEDH
jgi:hypothetical protein